MAKKSMIARDVKRKKMVERYAAKRSALMAAFNAADDPMDRLRFIAKSKPFLETVLLAGFATAVGPQANLAVCIETSAYAAINCVNVLTKGSSLEWSSRAGERRAANPVMLGRLIASPFLWAETVKCQTTD